MIGAEGIATQAVTVAEVPFQIDDFKAALAGGNEVSIYDSLVSSNLQTNNTMKVPPEALFINWNDGVAFRYRSASMDHIGVDVVLSESQKGALELADCNLLHRLLIKGFSLNQTVKYLLDTFTLQNSYG